jgi:hypothetical protein
MAAEPTLAQISSLAHDHSYQSLPDVSFKTETERTAYTLFKSQALAASLASFFGWFPNRTVKVFETEGGAELERGSELPPIRPPQTVWAYPAHTAATGPAVVVGEGHFTLPQGEFARRSVEMENVNGVLVARRILEAVRQAPADSEESRVALKPLVRDFGQRWWPSYRDRSLRQIHTRFAKLNGELQQRPAPKNRDAGSLVRRVQWNFGLLKEDQIAEHAAEIVKRAADNVASVMRIYGSDVGDWSNARVEFVLNAGTPLAYDAGRRVLQADFFSFIEWGEWPARAWPSLHLINSMKLHQTLKDVAVRSPLANEVVLVLLDLEAATGPYRSADERAKMLSQLRNGGAKTYSRFFEKLTRTDEARRIPMIVRAIQQDPAWAARAGLSPEVDLNALRESVTALYQEFRGRWRYGSRVFLDPDHPESPPLLEPAPAPIELQPPPLFSKRFWMIGSAIIVALATYLYVDWRPLKRWLSDLVPARPAAQEPAPSASAPGLPGAPSPEVPGVPSVGPGTVSGTLVANVYHPGGDNVYEPGTGSETTYDRVNRVMGTYKGFRVIGHQADSGEPDVHVGPPPSLPPLRTLNEVITIRIGNTSADEMLMVDYANVLEEGGTFSQAGRIDFVPSDKLAEERSDVTLRLPPMRKGQAMRLPVILNGRIDPQSLSDPRFAADAQGWLTARQDVLDQTLVTFDWIKTLENGSFRADFPVTPWMQREFNEIPGAVRNDLDRGKGLWTDRARASVFAGVVNKYLGYNVKQKVALRKGTWMNFLGLVLRTEDRFVSDCDVLTSMAFIFARYLKLDAIMVVGFNNRGGGSLVGRESAHAALIIRIGNKWLYYDPSLEAPFVSLERLKPESQRTPFSDIYNSMRPPPPEPTPEPGGLQPSSLVGSRLQAAEFRPDQTYYPPRPTEEELAAKAERRRKLNLDSRALQPEAKPDQRPATYRVQPGQSFDDVARAVFKGESYYYPDALNLIVDNINYTVDGNVDQLLADVDLVVQPVKQWWERTDLEQWEGHLFDTYGRGWYQRRHRLLQKALLAEGTKPSAYTPEIQAELRRRAGARWPSIQYDLLARQKILARIERARGVTFERRDLEAVIIESLATSARVLRSHGIDPAGTDSEKPRNHEGALQDLVPAVIEAAVAAVPGMVPLSLDASKPATLAWASGGPGPIVLVGFSAILDHAAMWLRLQPVAPRRSAGRRKLRPAA